MKTEDGKVVRALNVRDVCAIIKACNKGNVKQFKLRELSLTFGDADLTAKGSVRGDTPAAVRAVELLDERGRSQRHAELREEALSLLAVENPVAYEQYLLNQTDDDDAEPHEDA